MIEPCIDCQKSCPSQVEVEIKGREPSKRRWRGEEWNGRKIEQWTRQAQALIYAPLSDRPSAPLRRHQFAMVVNNRFLTLRDQ